MGDRCCNANSSLTLPSTEWPSEAVTNIKTAAPVPAPDSLPREPVDQGVLADSVAELEPATPPTRWTGVTVNHPKQQGDESNHQKQSSTDSGGDDSAKENKDTGNMEEQQKSGKKRGKGL